MIWIVCDPTTKTYSMWHDKGKAYREMGRLMTLKGKDVVYFAGVFNGQLEGWVVNGHEANPKPHFEDDA